MPSPSLSSQRRVTSLYRVFIGCIVGLALLAVACQQVMPFAPTRTTPVAVRTVTPPSNLLTPHILTVGSYANYLPQEYTDAVTHQVMGFDIDLIKAMAQRMHLKVNIMNEGYQTLLDSLMGGRFDVVISAMSITADLQKKVKIIPYFKGGESLLVEKGNPRDLEGLGDLCGQKVGVKKDTFEENDLRDASETCRKTARPPIGIIVAQTYEELVQLLDAKEVTATYQDSAQTDYFIKQHPAHFERGGVVIDSTIEGIIMRKEDASMFTALQAAFNMLKADGTYKAIIKRWGLTSGDITST